MPFTGRLEPRDRDDSLYKDIAVRLRRARRQRGLNQESLAAELGVSRGLIASMETGRCAIEVQYIADLATILHCRPIDLLPDSWK